MNVNKNNVTDSDNIPVEYEVVVRKDIKDYRFDICVKELMQIIYNLVAHASSKLDEEGKVDERGKVNDDYWRLAKLTTGNVLSSRKIIHDIIDRGCTHAKGLKIYSKLEKEYKHIIGVTNQITSTNDRSAVKFYLAIISFDEILNGDINNIIAKLVQERKDYLATLENNN